MMGHKIKVIPGTIGNLINLEVFYISKNLLNSWYKTVFEWLFKCEQIFGFKELSGYETGRIYAYLAERYLPFWFKKYSKVRTWPIYSFDSNQLYEIKLRDL